MNLGERSTQSLPTLLRRDSLQAEMGLFAFSGSHSSGGFTQGGESALDFRGSSALLAGPLAPLGSDAAPPLRHTYALLKGPPGIGARPFLKRLPHQAPPSAHGRSKKDATIFESEESLRQVQLAATRVEERKMEQARRRDAARFKREENTKLERKRLMAALEERRTRTDRAEAAAKRQLRATLWLALLHGGCFARASGRGLGAGRKRIAARRWQHAAVAVVQRLYRARAARLMWHRFACYARLMRKQRLRMCLHVRCFKRWHARTVSRAPPAPTPRKASFALRRPWLCAGPATASAPTAPPSGSAAVTAANAAVPSPGAPTKRAVLSTLTCARAQPAATKPANVSKVAVWSK